MRRLIILAAFAIGNSFTSGSVQASTQELDDAIINLLKPEAGNFNKEHRKKIAKAGADYWENFYSRIPKPLPEEQRWYDTERFSGNKERAFSAFKTRIGSLDYLSIHSSECVIIYMSIYYFINKSIEDELYWWLKSIPCFRGYSDLVLYFTRAEIGVSDLYLLHTVDISTVFHTSLADALFNDLLEKRARRDE